ncbi:MAG TPA: DUF167 domain-containing protein [Dehalococcoidia bacterium]|nr:DUF167 domain-containing protein [Dehalococcoidia bacterium]
MSRPTEPANTVKVRVQPRASRNQIVGFVGDTLRVRVTAPPEDGKANQAVIALLADGLDVARSSLQILRGHSSRDKLVAVNALNPAEIRRRLQMLAG